MPPLGSILPFISAKQLGFIFAWERRLQLPGNSPNCEAKHDIAGSVFFSLSPHVPGGSFFISLFYFCSLSHCCQSANSNRVCIFLQTGICDAGVPRVCWQGQGLTYNDAHKQQWEMLTPVSKSHHRLCLMTVTECCPVKLIDLYHYTSCRSSRNFQPHIKG